MFAKTLSRRDGLALPAVLGAVAILLATIVGITAVAKSELRAAKMEADVAQSQLLVFSGLQEAARRIQGNQITFWDPKKTKAEQGYSPCSFIALAPHYCSEALQGTPETLAIGATSESGTLFPIRVRWRIKASDTPHLANGWVFHSDAGDWSIYYDHVWCRPKSNWDWLDPAACEQGG